jgi:hypothetical protein
MDPNRLLETAKAMMPDITAFELAVVGAVWMRIYADREEPDRVVRWARKLLGLVPTPEHLAELREGGASVREIAAITGLPKSTVARQLSHLAA